MRIGLDPTGIVARSAFVASSTTETESDPVLVMNTRPVEDEDESDLAASRGEAAARERAKTTR
jgi:hypothetical protein